MGKLIRLTRRVGGPIYINPDHIVAIGSESPNSSPDSPAFITLVTSISTTLGAGTPPGLHVVETIQQVADMIDPSPQANS